MNFYLVLKILAVLATTIGATIGEVHYEPSPDLDLGLTTLNLFNSDAIDTPIQLDLSTLQNISLDQNVPVKILIPGWLSSGNSLWIMRMKDKHFLNGKHSVIIVDWKQSHWEYSLAASQVKNVAKHIAKILVAAVEVGKMDPSEVHIVGHCLGAHVAGIIGKQIFKQLGTKVGRITGLDPARSLYEFPVIARLRNRLGRGDADLVDVIHTCAGRLGFKAAIGDLDFYPNDGKPPQPGCSILNHYTCSQERAYHLYTESITTKNFLGTPCTSWRSYNKGKCDDARRVIMGFHLNAAITASNGPQKYYLRTNAEEPYSKG